MAMTRRTVKEDNIILSTINDLVPQDHLVRKLDNCIDWGFIYPLVEPLYSKYGRPSIDPVILFKLLIINIVFHINFMRATCEDVKVNLAYRWFLGLSMDEEVPNYSTWSQNYIRRYGNSEVFDAIFKTILKACMDNGYVDLTTVFGDSTHQKANANTRKCTTEEVDVTKKIYEDALLEEINEDRKAHGKKPFDSLQKEEYLYDEETGEITKAIETKEIKVSTTDPESGCFHKGEKEKCFAYSHQTLCDKNGFVVTVKTVPGNIHDSISFFDMYNCLDSEYREEIKNICLDAGYFTPAICREMIVNNKNLYLPYKRPQTKKGFFKKHEYVYDEYYDCILCPNDKVLSYYTTTRNGYREYKSNPEDCKNCPFKEKCTQSKQFQKVVTRHIWEEYKEMVDENRYTPEWQEIYPKRKETIERVFADCKENHNLRYTRLRGLKKNQHQALMLFACHNLKRCAKWSWKKLCAHRLFVYIFITLSLIQKKSDAFNFESTTLSTI